MSQVYYVFPQKPFIVKWDAKADYCQPASPGGVIYTADMNSNWASQGKLSAQGSIELISNFTDRTETPLTLECYLDGNKSTKEINVITRK